MKWKTVLNSTDICRLVELEKHCHIPRDRLSVDDYIQWMYLGLTINYICDETGRWIACYQLIEDENDVVHIVGVGVHTDHQGQGLGHALIAHAVQQAGHRILKSKTRQDNVAMLKCFQRAGFHRLPDEIEMDDDIVDTWTWWQRNPGGS